MYFRPQCYALGALSFFTGTTMPEPNYRAMTDKELGRVDPTIPLERELMLRWLRQQHGTSNQTYTQDLTNGTSK
jgi:hypothetical protein